MSEKKKFKDTGFGKFIEKAGQSIPDILDIGAKAITGNFSGALEEVSELLGKKKDDSPEASLLFREFEKFKMTYQKELYEIEIKDKDSARKREVEILKAGGTDWMMNIVGMAGLIAFCVCVYAVIWIEGINDNKMFLHLMGIIEGVVMVNLFGYYFGTSKN